MGRRLAPQAPAIPSVEGSPMPTVTVGQENNADIEIYYEDYGAGPPVVLIHGYPLSGRAWDDTPAGMRAFRDTFYTADTLAGPRASDQAYQASGTLAVTASATAAVACIGTWTTDFRDDLPKIDVPMLVVQGDADQVLPLDKTGSRLPGLIKDMHLVVIEGGPHAIAWTHASQVNTALLDFLRT